MELMIFTNIGKFKKESSINFIFAMEFVARMTSLVEQNILCGKKIQSIRLSTLLSTPPS